MIEFEELDSIRNTNAVFVIYKLDPKTMEDYLVFDYIKHAEDKPLIYSAFDKVEGDAPLNAMVRIMSIGDHYTKDFSSLCKRYSIHKDLFIRPVLTFGTVSIIVRFIDFLHKRTRTSMMLMMVDEACHIGDEARDKVLEAYGDNGFDVGEIVLKSIESEDYPTVDLQLLEILLRDEDLSRGPFREEEPYVIHWLMRTIERGDQETAEGAKARLITLLMRHDVDYVLDLLTNLSGPFRLLRLPLVSLYVNSNYEKVFRHIEDDEDMIESIIDSTGEDRFILLLVEMMKKGSATSTLIVSTLSTLSDASPLRKMIITHVEGGVLMRMIRDDTHCDNYCYLKVAHSISVVIFNKIVRSMVGNGLVSNLFRRKGILESKDVDILLSLVRMCSKDELVSVMGYLTRENRETLQSILAMM